MLSFELAKEEDVAMAKSILAKLDEVNIICTCNGCIILFKNKNCVIFFRNNVLLYYLFRKKQSILIDKGTVSFALHNFAVIYIFRCFLLT
jgi:predicted ribosome-associated RNA-binding protein Tma20